jgi:hypothetical protein
MSEKQETRMKEILELLELFAKNDASDSDAEKDHIKEAMERVSNQVKYIYGEGEGGEDFEELKEVTLQVGGDAMLDNYCTLFDHDVEDNLDKLEDFREVVKLILDGMPDSVRVLIYRMVERLTLKEVPDVPYMGTSPLSTTIDARDYGDVSAAIYAAWKQEGAWIMSVDVLTSNNQLEDTTCDSDEYVVQFSNGWRMFCAKSDFLSYMMVHEIKDVRVPVNIKVAARDTKPEQPIIPIFEVSYEVA